MSILRTKVRPKVRITLRKTLLHIDFEATNKDKNVKYLALTSQDQLNWGSKEFIGWLSPPPLELTQGQSTQGEQNKLVATMSRNRMCIQPMKPLNITPKRVFPLKDVRAKFGNSMFPA